ncbi:uncharacterized protein BDR25DRAFT_354083 [Lindgomyces ingoldianus]|uniref:Uncharacterized protein n=1 Tax=Lindgomyces ingoldianus TaxID=673940 RepID=A0ACB6QX29_9PLEO|nr:uncharacterized protein BDR25DRAFT_354083 [Lindgomyces ingoldianus]KAF2471554.1 hypothetical protein BDR25DRAFT_354083 [Lindgomyces ingoldianus]
MTETYTLFAFPLVLARRLICGLPHSYVPRFLDPKRRLRLDGVGIVVGKNPDVRWIREDVELCGFLRTLGVLMDGVSVTPPNAVEMLGANGNRLIPKLEDRFSDSRLGADLGMRLFTPPFPFCCSSLTLLLTLILLIALFGRSCENVRTIEKAGLFSSSSTPLFVLISEFSPFTAISDLLRYLNAQSKVAFSSTLHAMPLNALATLYCYASERIACGFSVFCDDFRNMTSVFFMVTNESQPLQYYSQVFSTTSSNLNCLRSPTNIYVGKDFLLTIALRRWGRWESLHYDIMPRFRLSIQEGRYELDFQNMFQFLVECILQTPCDALLQYPEPSCLTLHGSSTPSLSNADSNQVKIALLYFPFTLKRPFPSSLLSILADVFHAVRQSLVMCSIAVRSEAINEHDIGRKICRHARLCLVSHNV